MPDQTIEMSLARIRAAIELADLVDRPTGQSLRRILRLYAEEIEEIAQRAVRIWAT